MKKVLLAVAVAATMVSGAQAQTRNEARATMVFEGYVSTSIPSDSLIITGIGGGDLEKGTLSVNNAGEVNTVAPVIFEVHRVNMDGTVGDVVRDFDGRIVNASLNAGGAQVNNAYGSVGINQSWMAGQAQFDQGFSVTGKTQSVAEYAYASAANQTGLDLAEVGTGTAIQASVVVVVSDKATTII